MSAPAWSAARATADDRVSMEMAIAGILGADRLDDRHGPPDLLIRRNFSRSGRVDSGPTSIMAAPSAIMPIARSTAASRSKHSPPSLNESGVAFTTPITSGRAMGMQYLNWRSWNVIADAGSASRGMGVATCERRSGRG